MEPPGRFSRFASVRLHSFNFNLARDIPVVAPLPPSVTRERGPKKPASIGALLEICFRDLEGIAVKAELSKYKPGGNGCLKIRNEKYSQAEGRHELLMKQR